MSKRRFSERCLCDKNPYTQTHKSSKCKMCLVSWHRCFCMDILLILIESHCVTHVSCSIRGDDVQGYIQTAGEPDPVRNPRIRLLNYWLLVAHRASPLIDSLTQSSGVIPTLHRMVPQDGVRTILRRKRRKCRDTLHAEPASALDTSLESAPNMRGVVSARAKV